MSLKMTNAFRTLFLTGGTILGDSENFGGKEPIWRRNVRGVGPSGHLFPARPDSRHLDDLQRYLGSSNHKLK